MLMSESLCNWAWHYKSFISDIIHLKNIWALFQIEFLFSKCATAIYRVYPLWQMVTLVFAPWSLTQILLQQYMFCLFLNRHIGYISNFIKSLVFIFTEYISIITFHIIILSYKHALYRYICYIGCFFVAHTHFY